MDLLIIDPQNDFCVPTVDGGSLYVPGAEFDLKRLFNFIQNNLNRIDNIHVTLDNHHLLDIAHPNFWFNSKNEHPKPFTVITYSDIEKDIWRPFHVQFRERVLEYTRILEKSKKYQLTIWPPHCLIGTWGSNIHSDILSILLKWECRGKPINYIVKGSNIWTEHYSAIRPAVTDIHDPSTLINYKLIQTLKESKEIFISGQALSHCVKATVEDIMDNFEEEHIKKLNLLIDTTSNVPGFEKNGEDFVNHFFSCGGNIIEAANYKAINI